MHRVLSSTIAKGIIGGMWGVILALLLWHAWTDHVAFHELDTYIRMVAPKINKLP